MEAKFYKLWVMPLSLVFFGAIFLQAQSPPPESTSKVKRVLLYNYNGGWNCADCREKTREVFLHLAQSKGFSVDTTSSVSQLSLENLKRYQVIIWNNNHDGAASVPEVLARNAVSEYVRQGGGWMLVNLANEHNSSWPFLTSIIGPSTSGWRGESVPADLVADSSAKNHPELRFILKALPDTIHLQTNWLSIPSFQEDAIPFKTLYQIKNADWIADAPNRYREQYIWANTHGLGKAFSIPLGWAMPFGTNDIMTQSDSAVPKIYWQGLRWLAGDFQGGCIDPIRANYNPEARVDDGSCQISGISADRRQARTRVKISDHSLHFESIISDGSQLRLINLRGQTLWKSTVSKAVNAIDLPGDLQAGLYFLEVIERKKSFQERILIP
jgi:hypothetical protein